MGTMNKYEAMDMLKSTIRSQGYDKEYKRQWKRVLFWLDEHCQLFENYTLESLDSGGKCAVFTAYGRDTIPSGLLKVNVNDQEQGYLELFECLEYVDVHNGPQPMVQARVPSAMREALKAKLKAKGMTVQDWLQSQVKAELAEENTND